MNPISTIESETRFHAEMEATVRSLLWAHVGPGWDTPISGDSLALWKAGK